VVSHSEAFEVFWRFRGCLAIVWSQVVVVAVDVQKLL